MFNEFEQAMIVIVAIAAVILVLYFILKRSSTPKPHSNQSQNNDIPEVVIQEPQIEPLSEVPLYGIEEGDFGVIAPVREDQLKELTDRRKSDHIIQKRSVPEYIKITKQNFAEFAGERILVAEDNHINQKVILGLLADSGIEVVMANDGQEALDILENDANFLMILMDAHMPRIDGFEATRTIRENPKYDHIVVVALSGDIATDDIQKMKDAGMSEQLAKPLRMESLYKIIYAYTGEKMHKDKGIEAVENKSFDTAKGLETCGGDENFYREILAEFMADYGNSPDRLGELLRASNIQDADAHLLDIIGVAANIGASSLGEVASNMKLALGDTHEQSYFSLFDQYKVKFDRLIEDIRAYL
ncbi:MAG: hypothetical protein QG558_635 [Campylobacterota bacterium]|nr:hypothetical protein [Campylobacterota bacterium]